MRYLPIVVLSIWLAALTIGVIRMDLINPPGIAVMFGCAVLGALVVMFVEDSQ